MFPCIKTRWIYLITILLVLASIQPSMELQHAQAQTPIAEMTVELPESIYGRGMSAAQWSPDNRRLALFTDTGIWLFDTQDLLRQPRQIERISSPDNLGFLEFSPSGDLVVIEGYLGRFLDPDSLATIFEFETTLGYVHIYIDSQDTNQLRIYGFLSTEYGQGMETWDIANRRLTEAIKLPVPDYEPFISGEHDVWTTDEVYSDDWSIFAIYNKPELTLWDTFTGLQYASYPIPNYDPAPEVSYFAAAFSPTATYLVYSRYDLRSQNDLFMLWDLQTGAARQLPDDKHKADTFLFTSDERILISYGVEGFIDFWDVMTGERLNSYVTWLAHFTLTVSPDSKWLAWVDTGRTLHVAALDTLLNTES